MSHAIRRASTAFSLDTSSKATKRVKDQAHLAFIRRLPSVVKGMTLGDLQRAHVERQEEWCPDQVPDLSFRGNEMAGEVGETIEALYDHIAELGKAAGWCSNLIKKLERERHGWRGSRATGEQLAEELADVIHTATLCAITAGVDIEAATVAKFNATSEKNGLATRILSSIIPATKGGVEAAVEAMRADPFIDDVHLMGTRQQDLRMQHYAEVALSAQDTDGVEKPHNFQTNGPGIIGSDLCTVCGKERQDHVRKDSL